MERNVIDLTGKKFGRLLVLGRGKKDYWTPDRRQRQIRWRVKCDCGTVKETTGYNLRSGTAVSCGCLRRERMSVVGRGEHPRGRRAFYELTGKRFGKLLVLYRLKKRGPSGNVRWMVSCDCGMGKVVLGVSLVKGEIKSCGCSRYEGR